MAAIIFVPGAPVISIHSGGISFNFFFSLLSLLWPAPNFVPCLAVQHEVVFCGDSRVGWWVGGDWAGDHILGKPNATPGPASKAKNGAISTQMAFASPEGVTRDK